MILCSFIFHFDRDGEGETVSKTSLDRQKRITVHRLSGWGTALSFDDMGKFFVPDKFVTSLILRQKCSELFFNQIRARRGKVSHHDTKSCKKKGVGNGKEMCPSMTK